MDKTIKIHRTKKSDKDKRNKELHGNLTQKHVRKVERLQENNKAKNSNISSQVSLKK